MKPDLTLAHALNSLYPQAKWHLHGTDYEQFTWLEDTPKPSKEELETELKRLIKQREDLEYQEKRAAEYPPITDYLDGVVKGDQEQIQTYIDACLAVKQKYPKPSQ